MRLGMVRVAIERLIEWDYHDAPNRNPIFGTDLPKLDEPLPKFLDDEQATKFMQAATRLDPQRRLVCEMLIRTGLRIGELCTLRNDAIKRIGDTAWMQVPVGKLHTDRYIPLHPILLELLNTWRASTTPNTTEWLITNSNGGQLDRYSVSRTVAKCGRWAGIGHVHPHQLRHTLATQAINRGMSLEAIAAMLGHKSMRMTLTYARIADRTVADQYFTAANQIDDMYETPLTTSPAYGPLPGAPFGCDDGLWSDALGCFLPALLRGAASVRGRGGASGHEYVAWCVIVLGDFGEVVGVEADLREVADPGCSVEQA
jgi:site-specific recombinase XerD